MSRLSPQKITEAEHDYETYQKLKIRKRVSDSLDLDDGEGKAFA